MKNFDPPLRHRLASLWATSPSLTAVGVMMALDVIGCLIAMLFDSRQITGVNAWLKPAKFALSSGITCVSLAWIAGFLPDWPNTRAWSERVFTTAIALEIVIIDFQAARGTTSHFNMAGTLNRVAFGTMGISIAIIWISMVAMAYALFRQKLQPTSWAWALRLGLLLSVVGAAGGGFMLRETPEQRQNPQLKQFGAHTVGAPDGGPGLPVSNWSENHGDLRVAHFLGLHGMQVIPILGWWIRKRRFTESQRTRLVWLASFTYVACFALLAWQALRGQALLQPDGKTLVAAGLLAMSTSFGGWIAISSAASSGLKRWAISLEVLS